MRSCRGIGACLLVVFAVLAGGASRAAAGTSESIKRYDVDITIEPTGALLIRETIDYDFGLVPHHGIFRDIPTRIDYPPKPNHDRVYPIDVISVRASEGTPADYSVSSEGDNERIKIGDPNRRSRASTSTRSRTACAAR